MYEVEANQLVPLLTPFWTISLRFTGFLSATYDLKKTFDELLLRLTHVGLSTGVSSSSYSRKPFPSRFLVFTHENAKSSKRYLARKVISRKYRTKSQFYFDKCFFPLKEKHCFSNKYKPRKKLDEGLLKQCNIFSIFEAVKTSIFV